MDAVQAKHYDVFVSYKREDDAAREVLCAALEDGGFDPWWDAKLGQGDFRDQLRDRINCCKVVIALWSRNAHARPDEVKMEMAHAFGVKKLLPVKLDDAPIPPQFSKENFLPFDGWDNDDRRPRQLEHILAEAHRLGARPSREPQWQAQPTIPVELGDLPAAPAKLIGRDVEMEMLRAAWRDRSVNAVVLHALGGAGKSALLRTFVNERLVAAGDGAARIYGWSAYSQGSGDQKRADADGFLSRALSDFGYEGPPIRDSVESGRTLARLVQQQRVLMLLDGLEPLQDPPGQMQGYFKDKGLAAFVKALGAQNAGLLVLTSRQAVPELNGFGALVIEHELEDLSDAAGADLLVSLGVKGKRSELEAAVRDLDGHALSVTLLGTYLAEVCGGDIRERERFRFGDMILSVDDLENVDRTVRYARRAEKILEAYLQRFDELGESEAQVGPPERALLRLLGLFERPAEGEAMDVLLAEPIPGLTDELFFAPVAQPGAGGPDGAVEVEAGVRMARLREAKARLRKLRLIASADPRDPHALDAHPLVRGFFASWLEKFAPDAAKVAHEKLFRHYVAAAPDFPDTLGELQPLFFAVQHGVKAGNVEETLRSVYWQRICRGDAFYTSIVLGAHGAVLAVASNYFERPWSIPRRELDSEEQYWVLAQASHLLATVGRLRDSLAPREVNLSYAEKTEKWEACAQNCEVLSLTLLQLGDVDRAILLAEAAVAHSDKTQKTFRKVGARAMLGQALEMGGQPERALACFEEATSIDGHMLYSLRGYQYGDVLVSRISPQAALDLGQDQLALELDLLGSAFGWLLIGRAQEALGMAEAAASLDRAVQEMRRAGVQIFLPLALLARAAHSRGRVVAGESFLLDSLGQDLAEVAEIAGTEMRLILADLALERARLALEVPSAFENAREEAAMQYAVAAQLVAVTGYRRRDLDLADVRARLAADSPVAG